MKFNSWDFEYININVAELKIKNIYFEVILGQNVFSAPQC